MPLPARTLKRGVYWSPLDGHWVDLDQIAVPRRRSVALVLLPKPAPRDRRALRITPRMRERAKLAACVLIGMLASMAWQLL